MTQSYCRVKAEITPLDEWGRPVPEMAWQLIGDKVQVGPVEADTGVSADINFTFFASCDDRLYTIKGNPQ